MLQTDEEFDRNRKNHNRNMEQEGECEHLKNLEQTTLKKFTRSQFGKCRKCTKKLENNEKLDCKVCLICGYQGCVSSSDSSGHFLDHLQSEPEHNLFLCLSSFQIKCRPCNRSYSCENFRKDKFFKKARDYAAQTLRINTNSVSSSPTSNRNSQSLRFKGIKNNSVMCYANSVIQCLNACHDFKYLMEKLPHSFTILITPKVPHVNPMSVYVEHPLGPIGFALSKLLKVISESDDCVICPDFFFNTIRRNSNSFVLDQEHDAQEFLLFLLNIISEEIKENIKGLMNKNLLSNPSSLKYYQKAAPEVLREALFQGKLQSKLECMACNHKTFTSEQFLDLSLSVRSPKDKKHMKNKKSLPDKIMHFLVNNTGTSSKLGSFSAVQVTPIDKHDSGIVVNTPSINGTKRNIFNWSKLPTVQNQNLLNKTDSFPQTFVETTNPISSHHTRFAVSAPGQDLLIASGSVYFLNMGSFASCSPDFPVTPFKSFSSTDMRLIGKNNESNTKFLKKHQSMSIKYIPQISRSRDSVDQFKINNRKINTIQDKFESTHSANLHQLHKSNSLLACLYRYFEEETFDGINKLQCSYCSEMNKETTFSFAKRQIQISRLPKILIVHLKRFESKMSQYFKINDHVSFPRVLDLKPFCSPKIPETLYQLTACIEHSGNLDTGHYVAYIRTSNYPDQWMLVNDSKVSKVSIDSVLKLCAFMLFINPDGFLLNSIRTINLLTRFRIVDNSELGRLGPKNRPARLINRLKKKGYGLGDIVVVAVKGQTCKAMIVGLKKYSGAFIPRTDSNNIILLDDNKDPLGTRITVPIPIVLREKFRDNPKILSMHTKIISLTPREKKLNDLTHRVTDLHEQMIVIIFVGPPGCGKGSTGHVVCKQFNLVHISTGDILRNVASSDDPKGQALKALLAEGKLVSDEIVLDLIFDFLEKHSDCSGYLFDGFPRTLPQAVGLDKILEKKGYRVDAVVEFNVEKHLLINRAVGRLIHPASGRVYHNINYPPKVSGKDDITGEPLVHREDDTADVIERRITSYMTATAPVVEYYSGKNLLNKIDANVSLEIVTDKIRCEIQKLLN